MSNSQESGWHSRGYLPHFDSPELVQSITFRLHDAIPSHVIERWKQELAWRKDLPASDPRVIALHRRIASYEDAGHGSCYLQDPRVAECTEGALLYFDGARYHLFAWCVMPNHVHALIETLPDFRVREVMHSWKSFTAHEADRILGRSGEFWMADYYDRFIRNEDHLAYTIDYIEQNPVKAGLVKHAWEWKYSSARRSARVPRAYIVDFG